MENNKFGTGFNNNTSRLTIGVIKNNVVNQRGILLSEGLKHIARENDVNLVVYSGGLIDLPSGNLEATKIYDFIDRNKFDGLIIWTGDLNWFCSHDKTVSFVNKYKYLPLISLEIKIDGITSILWDDYNGMRDAIIHLIEVHKYRRIAFIHGPKEHAAVNIRYRAYIDTLTEYGIPIDNSIIFDQTTLYNHEESAKLYKRFLEDGVEALVSINDYNVRSINKIIKDRNLPLIPMIGFDDDLESSACTPALTSVRPPIYELGKRAVELLLAKIKGFNTPEIESLPCNLVVRQSCGCPCSSVIKETFYNEKINHYLTQTDIKNINAAVFEKAVKSVIAAPIDMDIDWVGLLSKVFFDEINGAVNNGFLNCLEDFFVQSSEKKYLEIFQDMIIVKHLLLQAFKKDNSFDWNKARKLLRQGAILIADMMRRVEMSKRLQKNLRHFDIISFTHGVTNAFCIGELVDNLIFELKIFGISSCYLSIYENDGVSTDKARIILAYNANGLIEIPLEKEVFPSIMLLPDGVLSYDKRFEYVLKPLYFGKRQIGFVLFEDTLDDPSEYQQLSEVISNAINGVKMIEDSEIKANDIIKTNNELEFAYRSLKENQQKLLISEKMASLGRLTAGIVHEMNTPLASVRTSIMELGVLVDEYINSIGNSKVLPDDHKLIAAGMSKYLKLANQAAEKSVGFIKGIKAQTTNMNVTDSQLFSAANVITDALLILDFALKKNKCKLLVDLDRSIKLFGDPNRLVQVVTNLVINAIDACKPKGGNISVTLQKYGNSFASIIVEDTGCGIPEEIASRIFEPMFTTKPFGEGTGLGLSIVHDIVSDFKGKIVVESKEGLTSFIITLPIKEKAI